MGAQRDIEFVYDDMDRLWRLSLGDHADITAAFYNGDYAKSLAEAQRDKHAWVLEGIGFRPGDRILDIGCGWGPLLRAVQQRGGVAVGLTLSPAQVKVCRQGNLDARLQDWKHADRRELGTFDGVVSLGAFEHFCTVDEYLLGQRDQIYADFFQFCHDVLKDDGRLFLQTMTWGQRVPWANRDPTAGEVQLFSDLRAPRKSDRRVLANVRAFFPGSWVPRNLEHIVQVARPWFDLIGTNDGRLDYVQTLTEWEKAWYAPGAGKTPPRMRMVCRCLLGGRRLRAKLQCFTQNSIRELFIRDLFGHRRIFFRKRAPPEASGAYSNE